jgi:hypothetical protein
MSNYPVQNVLPLINCTKTVAGAFTFALVSLESTGTDNRAEVDVDGMEQAILHIRYRVGEAETGNVLVAKVEFSPDGTNYFQEATEAVATATITQYQATRQFTGAAAGNYDFRIAIPVADIKKLRVTFTETGVASIKGAVGALIVLSGK